jgi:hypothetical protein
MDTPTNLESPPPRWRVAPYDPADAAPEGGEHRGRFPGADMYAADCLGDTLDVEARVVLSADMPVVPVDVEVERDPCECGDDIVDHPTELDVDSAHAPVWDEDRNPGPCVVAGCGCDGFTRAETEGVGSDG